MTIYRGLGGGGDATTDSELNALAEIAQQASGSASAAATSASSAATSATNAANSASSASTSASNASASASASASSAAASATSASNAATSESNAAASAASAAATVATIDTPTIVRTTGNQTIGGTKTFSSPISGSVTGTAANVTGTVAVANGGTGATTAQSAINTLAGAVTSGSYLRGNGTNVVMSAIQAADVPTLNQNTTGTASNVTGTVAIANGGTGSTTAVNARTALGLAIGTDIPAYTLTTLKTSSTGSSVVPSGTTAQRDGSPTAGYFRFNSSLSKFEGYNGTAWGAVGGGATGAGGDAVFNENDQVVTTSYSITAGKNALTAGPITINSGVTVTIPSGSVWTVV